MDLNSDIWRWIRSAAARKLVMLVGVTIILTLVVSSSIQLSRDAARARQTGMLLVDSESTLMVAELVGDGTFERFSVPTQTPIKAPVGDYQLRVGRPGQLSRSYDITLSYGSYVKMAVKDDDRSLWQVELPNGPFVSLDHVDSLKKDLVIAGSRELRRINGVTGELVWAVDFAEQQKSLRETVPGFLWPDRQFAIDLQNHHRTPRVTLIVSGDLNGDQHADVVIASQRQAWLMAVSGQDGSVLWLAARGAAVIAPTDDYRRRTTHHELESAVLGAPQRAGDLDGDGVGDLVASMIDRRNRNSSTQPGTLVRWVEAISGATGKALWRYEFAAAAFQLPPNIEPPDVFRWMHGHVSFSSSHGSTSRSFNRYTRRRTVLAWSGSNEYQPGLPRIVALPDAAGELRNQVVVIGGQQLVTLDAKTGQADNNVSLKQLPNAPLRLADMDGDKIPEVVLVSKRAPPPNTTAASLTHIAVHSLTLNKPLWSRTVMAEFPTAAASGVSAPDWPWIEDLDGDGRSEVLLPGDVSLKPNRTNCSAPLEVLRGDTGKRLWSRTLFTVDSQIDSFTTGPDIDGDGYREVFAATLWGPMVDLYVDCLSGADGHSMWREHRQLRRHDQATENLFLGQLSWWDATGDGWPQLLVHAADQYGYVPRSIALFSAGTGDITQVGSGITEARAIDVDGDGWDELITTTVDSQTQQSQFTCLAGIAADHRRWVVSQSRQTDEQDRWFPVADFDRDGIVDLVRVRPDGWVHVFSGGNGTLIWKRRETSLRNHQSVSVTQQSSAADEQQMDLDGDQVPDLVIGVAASYNNSSPPLLAMSGRDGRRLWQGGPDIQHAERDMTTLVRDLDDDGRGEIIMMAGVVFGSSRPRAGWAERQTLFVVDGRSGKVRWQQPLQLAKNPWAHALPASWLWESVADFNGDGTLDVAVPAESLSGATKFELRGYDGANGEKLWTIPLQSKINQRGFDDLPRVLTCDANGDAKADLVVPDLIANGQGGQSLRLRMVDGIDGTIMWSQSVRGEAYRSHSQLKTLRLLLLRDQARGSRICLNFAAARDQLAIIDLQGKWQPAAPKNPQNRRSFDLRLWACDGDADGTDELLMIDEKTMRVVAIDDVETPRWERKLDGAADAFEYLLMINGSANDVAVIYDQDARRFEGINMLDGKALWTCRWPSNPTSSYHPPLHVLTNGQKPLQAPRALVSNSFETLLRQVTPATATTADKLAMRSPPTLRPATDDARLARQLPWYFDLSSPHRSIPIGFVVWSTVLCLSLIVLPVTFVARMIRRRQWGLRTLLAAPAVVAILLVFSRMNAPDWVGDEFSSNWTVALAPLPVLMLIYLLGRAAVQRTWKNAVVILGVFVVTTVGLGAMLLTADVMVSRPWQSGEYYLSDGWFLIVFPGVYATGWLSLLIFISSHFARPKRRLGTVAAGVTSPESGRDAPPR